MTEKFSYYSFYRKSKIMPKIFFFLFFLFFFPISIKALDIYSEHAILYNMNENTVLFEKNAEEKIPIASLTKIMTAIVAIENISDLEEKVPVPKEALEGLAAKNAMVVGLKVGEEVTFRDLLYGVLLPSGADATGTIAYYVSGNEENYVKLMNEKAQELNLSSTHFSDTSGLDDQNNYSSVKDVSILLQYALKNEEFKKIFTSQEYLMSNGTVLKSTLVYYTEKFALDNKYIYGSKTGFTTIAGFCLASIAESNGVEYLLVTAKAPTTNQYPYHFADALKIYEYYGTHYQYQNIYKKEESLYFLDTLYSQEEKYEIKAVEDYSYYLPNDTNLDKISFQYEGIDVVTPFTKKGKIGTLEVYLENTLLKTIEVSYDGTLSLSIIRLFKEIPEIPILIIIVVLSLLYVCFRKKKRKKRYKRKI